MIQTLKNLLLVKFQLNFFFKCDFVMDNVTVCVNEALKTGSFPDSLKCANVRPIYKKVDPFDKNQ